MDYESNIKRDRAKRRQRLIIVISLIALSTVFCLVVSLSATGKAIAKMKQGASAISANVNAPNLRVDGDPSAAAADSIDNANDPPNTTIVSLSAHREGALQRNSTLPSRRQLPPLLLLALFHYGLIEFTISTWRKT